MAKKEDIDDELEREDDESEGESESADESGAEASGEESEDEADARSESEAEADDSPESHEEARAKDEARELAEEARALLAPEEAPVPAQLGSTRYVHVAFFSAGILVAYISSKILGLAWSSLADWPAATRQVPLLLRFAEDERGSYALAAGALIGVITVIQTYRNEKIRRWADEVASELSKVTWPTRDTVTNGTVVVIVASMIATVYVALLDWLWRLLSTSVYGA